MKVHFLRNALFGLAVIAGFSAVVMLLWNFAVPSIFGLATINFWQALGLLVLARILFGGFGGGFRGGFGGGARGGADMHSHINPLREKWEKMTPEERKDFLNKRHESWRRGGFNKGDFFGARGFGFEDETKKEDE
jgi:hypothetical protein